MVTSLRPGETRGRRLYETLYCARGEREIRIKECQLDLFAGPTSARSMRANQLRLYRPRPTIRRGGASGTAKPIPTTAQAQHRTVPGLEKCGLVARLPGHSNIRMTLRYAHLGDCDIEAAAERIGGSIAAIMEDRDGP